MLSAIENQQPLAQQSLFPETITLNTSDYQVFLEMSGDLEKMGFDIRDFGNNSVVVHGFPADMIPAEARDSLELMIEQYKTLKGIPEDANAERLSRSAARVSAINYGKSLTGMEMQEIIDQLFACTNPNYTPSGKLIVKIIELEELDSHFKE
jgi:DNA mismatch repair protein MutL